MKQDILNALNHSNIFITGGAGVGKSYITNEIIREYKSKFKGVVALGSTGISAVNIGGFTLHSFFVFGISNNLQELVQNDKKGRYKLLELKKILKATELIIIDEVSMISSDVMDMIYYRLSSYGYYGKIMFVGDFFQLPPIVKTDKSNQDNLFNDKLYAFESDAWDKFNPYVIELKEMKRTSDIEFTDILSKIRAGHCDESVVLYMFRLANNRLKEKNPTYLYGRNVEVDRKNRDKLDELSSEETILFANLEMFKIVNEKRLESWKKLLPITEQLTLKVGVPILFTINNWGKFVNGERGIVVEIGYDYVLVEKNDGIIKVERYGFDLLDIKVNDDGEIENIALATLSQFPIKLAYAVTIHKSQGMSIDNLVCNMDNIFVPSQFYVALSRATNPKNLRLDFNRGDLAIYLQRVVNVDSRVVEYYKNDKQ